MVVRMRLSVKFCVYCLFLFLLRMLLYTYHTNSNTFPILLFIKTTIIQNNVPSYKVNQINNHTSNKHPLFYQVGCAAWARNGSHSSEAKRIYVHIFPVVFIWISVRWVVPTTWSLFLWIVFVCSPDEHGFRHTNMPWEIILTTVQINLEANAVSWISI